MLYERSLLNDTNRFAYDSYKRIYAEMLFRWNLLISRAKVLKYLSVNHESNQCVEFVTECSTCQRVTRAPVCQECRKPLMNCVLCRLPVKGLANVCLNCGHGGHTLHMKKWFSVSMPITKRDNAQSIIINNTNKFRVSRYRKTTNAPLDVAACAWILLLGRSV